MMESESVVVIKVCGPTLLFIKNVAIEQVAIKRAVMRHVMYEHVIMRHVDVAIRRVVMSSSKRGVIQRVVIKQACCYPSCMALHAVIKEEPPRELSMCCQALLLCCSAVGCSRVPGAFDVLQVSLQKDWTTFRWLLMLCVRCYTDPV